MVGDARARQIVDDEPRMNITSVRKNEGSSATTTFNFTVSLSAASTAAVTVNLQTGPRDKTVEDYEAGAGALASTSARPQTATVASKGKKVDVAGLRTLSLKGTQSGGRSHRSSTVCPPQAPAPATADP